MKDGKSLVREGDNRYHAIFLTDGDALFVSPSSLAVPLIALGAKATILGPKGERTVPVEELYQVPKKDGDRELTIAPRRGADQGHHPGARRQERLVRGPAEAGARLAAGPGLGGPEIDGDKVSKAPRRPLRRRADPLPERGGREGDRRARRSRWRRPPPPPRRPSRGPSRSR